jgi:hypothetical protein
VNLTKVQFKVQKLFEPDLKSGSAKAEVWSKITEPDCTQVQGPEICLNQTESPVQGSRISAKNWTKLDHGITTLFTVFTLNFD